MDKISLNQIQKLPYLGLMYYFVQLRAQYVWGGTLGSDVTLYLEGVFVIVWCRTIYVGAGLAPW